VTLSLPLGGGGGGETKAKTKDADQGRGVFNGNLGWKGKIESKKLLMDGDLSNNPLQKNKIEEKQASTLKLVRRLGTICRS